MLRFLHSRRRPLLAGLSCLLFTVVSPGPLRAQEEAPAVEAQQAVDPAEELARARALKSDAAELRRTTDARFRDQEIACYKRFLVSRCIEEARRHHLDDVRRARAMDNEAGRIELAEKNRRFNERQAQQAQESPRKSVERAEQEALNRADSEARLRQLSEKDAARVKQEQDGKSRAMQAVAERNRKEAADASRRAADARAAAIRAEQSRSDKTYYKERAAKAAEKKAEKAEKARREAAGQKTGRGYPVPLPGK